MTALISPETRPLIEGTISIVGGCIGLDGDGPWLVWPIDYGLGQDDDPPLEDLGRSATRRRDGGRYVRLGGGIGSIPDPVLMPGGVPDDYRGEGESYWYVGDIEVIG